MAVEGRGVIYIGHLPMGFAEPQLRNYFSQFGVITRLRLSRCPKTGRSRHYAFVEFASSEVAEIAAEAMNGYLIADSIIKCNLVRNEKVHPRMFFGFNRRFRPSNAWMGTVRVQNECINPEKRSQRIQINLKKIHDKLKAMGANPPNLLGDVEEMDGNKGESRKNVDVAEEKAEDETLDDGDSPKQESEKNLESDEKVNKVKEVKVRRPKGIHKPLKSTKVTKEVVEKLLKST